MPTYEYRCKECGHEFETVQAFTDAALTECPQCQGQLRKVFGNVGIAFKGSGFYKNDSRESSSKAKSSNGDSTSSTGSSESSSSSGDSKPDSSSSTGSANGSSEKKSDTKAAPTPPKETKSTTKTPA